MTEATLLLLTTSALLPFCIPHLLPPSHEEDECGADDWLQLSSGHWMPRIGLGTAGLSDPTLVASVVSDALAVGYRLIDTADLYENHQQIASALNFTLPSLGLKRNQSHHIISSWSSIYLFDLQGGYFPDNETSSY